MGMTALRKRSAALGCMASMAAIPREDIAKLIERCWAAAFEDGRRMSAVLGVIDTHRAREVRA